MSVEILPLPVAAGGGSGGSSNVIVNKTIYVMDNGDNETADNYDLSKPYHTLNEARDVAVSGDTIVVYPGSYLATLNLAKDNVKWHFSAGASVTYLQTEYLFDTVGFESDTSITGNGSFYSPNGGIINHQTNSLLFEFYECIGVAENLINLTCIPSKNIHVKGTHQVREESDETNFLNKAIRLYPSEGYMLAKIDIPKVYSHDSIAFYIVGEAEESDSVLVICSDLNGRIMTNTGTWIIDTKNESNMMVEGPPGGVIQITGHVNSLLVSAVVNININGYIGSIAVDHNGARLTGGTTSQLIMFGGMVEDLSVASVGDTDSSSINISDGSASLYLKNNSSRIILNLDGGRCLLKSNILYTAHSSQIYLNDGRLTLEGMFMQQSCNNFITMYNGVLDLGNSTINMASTDPSKGQIAIYQYGGVIISNGATIHNLNPGTLPIMSIGTKNNLLIKTGGFNTTYTGALTNALGNDLYFLINGLDSIILGLNDGNGGSCGIIMPNSYETIPEYVVALVNEINAAGIGLSAESASEANYFIVRSHSETSTASVDVIDGSIVYDIRNPAHQGVIRLTNVGILQSSGIQI
jgi:hypothetical protein